MYTRKEAEQEDERLQDNYIRLRRYGTPFQSEAARERLCDFRAKFILKLEEAKT